MLRTIGVRLKAVALEHFGGTVVLFSPEVTGSKAEDHMASMKPCDVSDLQPLCESGICVRAFGTGISQGRRAIGRYERWRGSVPEFVRRGVGG